MSEQSSKNLKSLSTALTAAVALSAAIPVAAQIDEIVVTARAVEESIRNIPVSITAINEERLERFSLNTMTDLEAMTPQLSIFRAGNGSAASVQIRGIGSTTTSIGIEQSVAVMIDGVYFPQGRAINEGLFDVSQVAILKGPQALYFGKNATAGVVSVMSNNPSDEFEASLRISNEFDTSDRVIEGIISVPVNEMLGIRLAVLASEMKKGPTDTSMGHPRPGSGGHSPPNFNMAKLMNAITS